LISHKTSQEYTTVFYHKQGLNLPIIAIHLYQSSRLLRENSIYYLLLKEIENRKHFFLETLKYLYSYLFCQPVNCIIPELSVIPPLNKINSPVRCEIGSKSHGFSFPGSAYCYKCIFLFPDSRQHF